MSLALQAWTPSWSKGAILDQMYFPNTTTDTQLYWNQTQIATVSIQRFNTNVTTVNTSTD